MSDLGSITIGEVIDAGQTPVLILIIWFLWRIDRALAKQQVALKTVIKFVVKRQEQLEHEDPADDTIFGDR